jgi:hypothetical protein
MSLSAAFTVAGDDARLWCMARAKGLTKLTWPTRAWYIFHCFYLGQGVVYLNGVNVI